MEESFKSLEKFLLLMEFVFVVRFGTTGRVIKRFGVRVLRIMFSKVLDGLGGGGNGAIEG